MRVAQRAVAFATVLVMLAAPAGARPYTVDDLLKQQSFGPVTLDPTGRWLVIERREAYDQTPRFDYSLRNPQAASRLLVVDLLHPTPPRRLPALDDGPGYTAAAFSPAGSRLAVYRLHGHHLDLGIVTVATGKVTWLGLTPEDALTNRAIEWRTENQLLVIARPKDSPPLQDRVGWQSAAELPARWAATARGETAATVIGSGAARGLRPRAADSHLWLIDLGHETRRELAHGALRDLELSPDGRTLAVSLADGDIQPSAGEPVQAEYGLQNERRRLALIDLTDGVSRALDNRFDVLDSLLAWSPDGRSLLIFTRADGEPWTAGALRRVDPRTAAASAPLGDGLAPVVRIRPETVGVAWVGGDPIVLAHPADGSGRPDWYRLTRDGPVNLSRELSDVPARFTAVTAAGLLAGAERRVWRLGDAGNLQPAGPAEALVVGWPRDQRSARLAQLPGVVPALLMRSEDASGAHLAPFGSSGGGHGVYDLPAGATPLAWSAAAKALVVQTRSPQGVERLLVLRPGAPPAEVSRINDELRDVPPPRTLAIHHLGPDGQALTSWLYLPPERSPLAPPPPLIVRPYLGESYRAPLIDAPATLGLPANIRMMVGHGYAVLTPSLPRPAKGEPLEGLADRVLKIVDLAVATPAALGAFDPARLALWGHSYGGYTALGILTQTNRFRAAVTSGAPSDLIGIWGTFQPSWRVNPEDGVLAAWPQGWTETAQGAMGAAPFSDPDRYVRNSPALLAEHIHTPVLLMHGDQDPIAVTQAEQMFSALYRQDRTAAIVTYWGEDHLLNGPGTVRDMYTRSFAWIDGFTSDPAKAVVDPPLARLEPGLASSGSRTLKQRPAKLRLPHPARSAAPA